MKNQLALTTRDHAYWDQAVDNLVTKVDMAWADTNIGAYLFGTLGVRFAGDFRSRLNRGQ